MKLFLSMIAALLIIACPGQVSAESELFQRFEQAYDQMGSELATKPPAEVAEITNFVYKKDVATFSFSSGTIYLLRPIEGRPTTAIFIGQGQATIDVPSHTERQSLLYVAADSLINESFEIAFLNFSDDFDLQLKEQFTFEPSYLPWRAFNKSQQGEFFFKPVVMHEYDNYFQLLRSLFERQADGYFWIDFNRYCYSFDPNRPEEVIVSYEHEGGDNAARDAVVMQRREKAVYDDYRMSDVSFPTTILSRSGELVMKGLDGQNIDAATIDLEVEVNADSLLFLSLYLHRNLTLDSMSLDGSPVDFKRRRSFAFTGIVLPEHRYRGDTLNLRLWYHGKDYNPALPFVANPAPSPHSLTFDIHTGYNYLMPAMIPIESPERGRTRFTSAPAEPYRMFQFQPYAVGFDTVSVISDIGMTLNIIRSKHINKYTFTNFIPHKEFQAKVVSSFNCLTNRLGPPVATFSMYVYPQLGRSMPGLMGISQTESYTNETGGLTMAAADAAARQWFGSLMRPATTREYWLMDAVPDYLSLVCVATDVNPSVFFGELKRRRDHIYTRLDNDDDMPLATGRRMLPVDRAAKGTWVLHMLRYLMYDLENRSDRTFWRFINELKLMVNSSLYTNEAIVKLAEKHYGQPLDWFFKPWLYGRDIPEYRVTYEIIERDGAYYIPLEVQTKGVPDDFEMPVIIRVASDDGTSIYERHRVAGRDTELEMGPYDFEPKEITFNEFLSVLSRDKVSKK